MEIITDQQHIMLKVAKKEVNCPEYATLFFEYPIAFKPGQFVMLWIPGLDEKPYTISHHSKNHFAITIEAKGLFSQKAVTLEKDDIIGVRGPFGNGFDIYPNEKVAVIAGGCGMAPLATLVEQLDNDICFIHGARSKKYLLYTDRFSQERQFCTDDGSLGHHGFVTDLFKKELVKNEIASGTNFGQVYTCGPEIMMYNVFKICEDHNIPCQVSLERYMRCGFGVCGACVCGDQVVCKDGPVFESKTLRKMKDFNKKALLKSGKDVDLSQYFSWRCK